MSTTQVPPPTAPMPENLRSVQPGGGKCYKVELAWGRLRRGYLKCFRPGYVARMAKLRKGSGRGAPHEILDPRDLKYCQNQCDCHWDPKDDPFLWRERLPFARWGLAELQLMGWPLLALTVFLAHTYWYMAPLAAIPLALVVWFFRDPTRKIPTDPGVFVSPADGKISNITRVDHEEFIGGPAVKIGIFLSIFNVHINRASATGRVLEIRYHPGEFLNALNPESETRNENIWIGIQNEFKQRRFIIRAIGGAIARRIVRPLKAGDIIARGEKIGMIKLGSRTELVVPDTDDLEINVKVGQKIRAGSSVLVKYRNDSV